MSPWTSDDDEDEAAGSGGLRDVVAALSGRDGNRGHAGSGPGYVFPSQSGTTGYSVPRFEEVPPPRGRGTLLDRQEAFGRAHPEVKIFHTGPSPTNGIPAMWIAQWTGDGRGLISGAVGIRPAKAGDPDIQYSIEDGQAFFDWLELYFDAPFRGTPVM